MRESLIALLAAAATVGTSAAQTVQMGPGGPPPPQGTGPVVIGGPQLEPLPPTALAAAERRAREVVALIDRASRAEIDAYVAANWRRAQAAPPPGAAGQRFIALEDMLARFQFESGGAELVSVAANEAGSAVTALYRSRMTGRTHGFDLVVSPEAPHRITRLMPRPPQLAELPQFRTDEERVAYLDALAGRMAEADYFSGVVLIARAGEPIFAQAYGFENRDARRPNRLDSRFNVGSMNKMFTAIAIMQLAEQGKLSLDDPIGRFLPDYPDRESAQRIRIKHLLSHTSGLGSYFNPAFAARPMTSYRGIADYLEVAGREPPAFDPGTGWLYSNTGMLLAGRIVEIASGEDYYDYVRRHIYGPAGMERTDSYEIDRLGDRAIHYDKDWSDRGRLGQVDSLTPVRGSPAGGGLATAEDLLRFDRAFHSGRLVRPETLRLMTSPKPELGSPRYGYGFDLGRFTQGRPVVGHGGDSPGTCAVYATTLDTAVPYTVIILANGNGMGSCHPLAAQAYALFAPAA